MRIDIATKAFKRDPFPVYARLRSEAPVARIMAGGREAWLVTRYGEAAALLKDTRFVKDRGKVPGARLPWMPGFARPLARNMLDLDDPDHRRLRALVHQAFTPRLVELMRPRIESLTHAMLDRAAPRRRIDLIADFAIPIPTTIIAEMLGVPERDRERFHRWTGWIVRADVSTVAAVRALPAMFGFMRYLRGLIAAKRTAPGEDLLSALVATRAEDGDRLSEDELVAMAFLLLVAGHETTVNLIGNGLLALMRHPDQLAALAADPALRKPAVEELLRYDGPLVVSTERYAVEDTALGGATIPACATVYAGLAAANRDERAFENPDSLDIRRTPNRHLAFGDGMHFCAGAALARLEAQIAIGELVSRFPALALAGHAPFEWKGGIVLRGLKRLPVDLHGKP